jgi:hypothetical protein
MKGPGSIPGVGLEKSPYTTTSRDHDSIFITRDRDLIAGMQPGLITHRLRDDDLSLRTNPQDRPPRPFPHACPATVTWCARPRAFALVTGLTAHGVDGD